ncbi:MAG: FeS cluster assembly protein SufD [Chlamydiae bacterium]|nr:FeS cluster assembly protein SufD [Chlamydiota bacterium]
MTSQTSVDKEAFLSNLEKQFSGISIEDALQKIKSKAWDHLSELGLPSRNMEVYRYINLRKLYSQSFDPSTPSNVEHQTIAPYVLPECTRSVLVFVNGHFQPHLSNTEALPDRVVVTPMAKAIRTYGTFLNHQWARSLKEETDPFAAMNAALNRDSAFLYLPPKTSVDTPIQLLSVVDAKSKPLLMVPRCNVFVGAQSRLEMVSTQAILSGESFFVNQCSEWILEEGAQVRYSQVNENTPENAWHFDAVRATLKRDSSFNTVSMTNGSVTVRNDYRIALMGENSEVLLNGLWMLKDKKEAHTNVVIDHQAPHCRSKQLFKGVLNDNSRSSFEGKIIVRPEAQKTDAFQLNQNLLLSNRANAATKPNLEIFADDVKASHGATVGQLDKEQLFYLKTRGYTNDAANNILVRGFCQEIMDLMRIPSLKEKCNVHFLD